MNPDPLRHEPSLPSKLLLIAWMAGAMAAFILVSVSMAPGSTIGALIPQFLAPLQEWLLGLFHAPALY